ncbi:hypothetical protein N7513_003123 [Penicillium frequentans]|nr:hypothetical protein N7513_003123 [Penicillium glabrum]
MGRPPYIKDDEWDVTDLDDDDFLVSDSLRDALQRSSPDDQCQHEVWSGQSFQHFIRLSRVADELQHSLYALKSAQRLCSDFQATLDIARPLLQKLKEWYDQSPASIRQRTRLSIDIGNMSSQSNYLHFSYILLEMFIFRALLRPMVRSPTPPPLFEEAHDIPGFRDHVIDLFTQIFEVDEFEPSLAINMSEESRNGSAVLKEAESCAAKMLRLAMRIDHGGFSGFWFSWSRIVFATVTNFMMLLLVQAPTKDYAFSDDEPWLSEIEWTALGWTEYKLQPPKAFKEVLDE